MHERTADPRARRRPPELDPTSLGHVRRVLYLHGLRGADVDDAAQDVATRWLERAPDGLRSPQAWLSVVASNIAVDRLRRARRQRDGLARVRATTAGAVAPPDVALAAAVRDGLAHLDPELRAVVVLRFYADLTLAEIARHLDAPLGTVKSRLHRAVAELRRWLPPEED